MKTLLHDLRLADRRDLLKDIFENAIPSTDQDVVIIFVTISGRKGRKLIQETYANKIYSQEVNGKTRAAIQITTAAAVCTMLDLLNEDEKNGITKKGLILQEQITLVDFLNNRFGKYFREEK